MLHFWHAVKLPQPFPKISSSFTVFSSLCFPIQIASLQSISVHPICRLNRKAAFSIKMPGNDVIHVDMNRYCTDYLHIFFSECLAQKLQVPGFCPGSMSSSTCWIRLRPLGVTGCLVTPSGTHGSLQILICWPLPTRQITPSFNTFIPCIMLLHVYEHPSFALAFNGEQFGKYFDFRILAHREVGFWMRRHPCLASMAMLKE